MDGNAKQLLSERIKNATNILVTVSRDPSVDELSAALGLTLMLNKMDKHATAVFSGAIPPAIEFLQPEKTFEGTVDSLRDFIIALDKEKADRLRYKVEDDVVRIFITPYRTIISEKDLQFSQGDFNVELIVALGVEKREDLDNAITAHGRILHDATVVTVNAGNQKSELGSIDWTDGAAGSLCEMLMSLSESLQSGILDEQISTALLTGIVAATDRFSNNATSPKVMTMAAQLMAAGANQQLIATKLEEGHELITPASAPAPDGSKKLTEGASEKLSKAPEPAPDPNAPGGEMHIDHEQAAQKAAALANEAEHQMPAPRTESKLSEQLAESMPARPTLSVDDLKKDLAAANDAVNEAANEPLSNVKGSDWRDHNVNEDAHEPAFGGTLNATTDEAAADKRREEESRRNHTLLSHDSPSASSGIPLNGAMADAGEPPTVDPFAEPPRSEPDAPMHYEPTPLITLTPPGQEPPKSEPEPAPAPEPVPEPPVPHTPTLVELEEEAHRAAAVKAADAANPVNDARAAVDAALNGVPFDPAHQPLESAGAMAFPDIPHTPDAAPAPPALPLPPAVPDFSNFSAAPPPLPDEAPPVPTVPNFGTPPASTPQVTPPPSPNDPGQFRLPGQQ
jgi:hypothetical protein